MPDGKHAGGLARTPSRCIIPNHYVADLVRRVESPKPMLEPLWGRVREPSHELREWHGP